MTVWGRTHYRFSCNPLSTFLCTQSPFIRFMACAAPSTFLSCYFFSIFSISLSHFPLPYPEFFKATSFFIPFHDSNSLTYKRKMKKVKFSFPLHYSLPSLRFSVHLYSDRDDHTSLQNFLDMFPPIHTSAINVIIRVYWRRVR